MIRIPWLSLLLMLVIFPSNGQPNCNVYLNTSDSACYKACILAIQAAQPQGTRESQLGFDEAIALCPTFDYAYFEKSVPYLKRGDLKTWKKLIDQAVALNPQAHLGYRGWCRYQFARDYKGALEDFQKLHTLIGSQIGYSQNGDYNFNIVEGLCYDQIGETEKAIAIIQHELNNGKYSAGSYDYLHLAVLKIKMKRYQEAISCLQKQIQLNDFLADTYYYLGIAHAAMNNRASSIASMIKAKEMYLKGYTRVDNYTQPLHKVYLSQIETALNKQ